MSFWEILHAIREITAIPIMLLLIWTAFSQRKTIKRLSQHRPDAYVLARVEDGHPVADWHDMYPLNREAAEAELRAAHAAGETDYRLYELREVTP